MKTQHPTPGPSRAARGASGARARPRQSESAFTTVELMVSLTVLVIAVLGAFTTFYGASTLLRDTAETYAAARDAETVLEDLVATPIGAVARVYPSDQPVPEFNGKSLSAEVVRISYPEGTGVRPLLVTVDVSWRDHRGRPRRLLYHRVRAR